MLGERSDAPPESARGTFDVINRLGLHARAATKLVQLASRFSCEVHVSRDDQRANAKSVMGVLLLCGSQGTSLTVEALGEGATEAVRQIGELISDRFGEEA
ncbi:MAG: HPr family phosphocarrier protein [Polyangiaceae bacterium]|nr:HPr family phosphocarrier protein [Polyangiaceae bacterium]